MSFKTEEEIEQMKEKYKKAIGDCMLSNFAYQVKLWYKDEITEEELLELDRKNMALRHALLKIQEDMTDEH